ncbi:serine-rich adhesin for platelets-like [Gigantopelta aegis]|uniref:serine-rich adhesin for platelets-like n=1 Tax=Gigantopelta aegis TaxID=1735272 RepID=UPI001B889B40|nr:serine-rich adhesin for platelets-like [Gigantopelta aegis]
MDRERGVVDTGWAGLQDADVQNAIATLAAMKAYKSRNDVAMVMMPPGHGQQDGLMLGLVGAQGGDRRDLLSQLAGQHPPHSQHQLLSRSPVMNPDMLRFAASSHPNAGARSVSNWPKKLNGPEHQMPFGGNDVVSSAMTTHSMSHLGQNSRCNSVVDLMMRPPFPVLGSVSSVESLNMNTHGMYSIPKVTDDLFKTPTQGNSGKMAYNPTVSLPQQDYQQHQHGLDLSGSFNIQQNINLPASKQQNDFIRNDPFSQSSLIPDSKFEMNVSRNSNFMHSNHPFNARQETGLTKDLNFLQNGPTSESMLQKGLSAMSGELRVSPQASLSPFHSQSSSRDVMARVRSEDIEQMSRDSFTRPAQQSSRPVYHQTQSHDSLRKDLHSQSNNFNKDGSHHQKYVDPLLHNTMYKEQHANRQEKQPQGFQLSSSTSGFSENMAVSSHVPRQEKQPLGFQLPSSTSGFSDNMALSSHATRQEKQPQGFQLSSSTSGFSENMALSSHAPRQEKQPQGFQLPSSTSGFSDNMALSSHATRQEKQPQGFQLSSSTSGFSENMALSSHAPRQEKQPQGFQLPSSTSGFSDNMALSSHVPSFSSFFGSGSNVSSSNEKPDPWTIHSPDGSNNCRQNVSRPLSQSPHGTNAFHSPHSFQNESSPLNQQAANERQTMNHQYHVPPSRSANSQQHDINKHAQRQPNTFNPPSQMEKKEPSPKYPFQSSGSYSESDGLFLPASHQVGGQDVNTQKSMMTPITSSSVTGSQPNSKSQLQSNSGHGFKDFMMDHTANLHNSNVGYSMQQNPFKIPPTPPAYQQKQLLPEKLPSKNTHKDEKSKLLNNVMPSAHGKSSIAKPKPIRSNPRKKKVVSPNGPTHQTNVSSQISKSFALFPPFSPKNDIARNKPKIGPGSEKKISDLMESEVDRKLLAMFPQYRFYLDQNVKPMEEIMPLPGENAIMKKIQKAGEVKKKRKLKKEPDVLSNIKKEMPQGSTNDLSNGISHGIELGDINQSVPSSKKDEGNINAQGQKSEITDHSHPSGQAERCEMSSGSTNDSNQPLDSFKFGPQTKESSSSSTTDMKSQPGQKSSGMCCSGCEDVGVMFSKQCQNKISRGLMQQAAVATTAATASGAASTTCPSNKSSTFDFSFPDITSNSVMSSNSHSVNSGVDRPVTVFSSSQNITTCASNSARNTSAVSSQVNHYNMDLKQLNKKSSDGFSSEDVACGSNKNNGHDLCSKQSASAGSEGKENSFLDSANGCFNKMVKKECPDSSVLSDGNKCESAVKDENSEDKETGGSPWEDMPLNNLQATIQKLFDRVYSDKSDDMDLISKFEQGHGNVEISPQKLASSKMQEQIPKHITPPSSPMNKQQHVETSSNLSSPCEKQQTPGTTPEKSKVHFDIDGVWANGRQVSCGLSESLDDHLRNNRVEVPCCTCLGPGAVPEETEGPYYTQLGSARNMQAIRAKLEARTGMTGHAIRIEKVRYTGKEGKTSLGCPMAKWIIRRSSYEEKYLCVVKQRRGHFCENAMLIIVLVAWEGVPLDEADGLYSYISTTVTKEGNETERRCGTNERRTCACQGIDMIRRGASFSFGCSWSMYFNGCKFARSRNVRKFKLQDTSKEEALENYMQELASRVGPLYKKVAPDAHRNQCLFSEEGQECRLGKNPPKEKPFSGVTACVDFCAHSHKDLHNINNGSTVVVTLSKNRGIHKPDDEQLHVLPLYVLDPTDEFGSSERQMEKIRSGALEILTNFPCEARIRSKPLTPCKKRAKMTKALLQNKEHVRSLKEKALQETQQKSKVNVEAAQKKKSEASADVHVRDTIPDGAQKGSFEQLIALSGLPNYQDLYEKFWDFFYSNGSFPPETFLSKWAEARGQVISPASHQNAGSDASAGQNPSVRPSPHPISQLSNQQQMDVSMQRPPEARFGQSQPDGFGLQMSNLASCNPNSGNGDPPMKKQCLMMPSVGDHPVDLTNTCENSRQPSCGSANSGQQNIHPHHPSEHPRSQEVRPMSAVPFNSPLDMLCEAAMRTDPPRPQSHPPSLSSVPYPYHNASLPGDSSQLSQAASNNRFTSSQHPMQQTALPLPTNNPNSHSNFSVNARGTTSTNVCANNSFCDPNEQFMCNPNQQAAMFQNGCKQQQQLSFLNGGVHQEEKSETVKCLGNSSSTILEDSFIDPTVVRCEMDYNESNFRDPQIGGVAIALGHGSVLFEVAKRELHATTALRSPNRYHPTRISLVFYQHKNLNYANHGWAEHEKKMELLHEKRMRAAVDKGVDVEDLKPGKRKKKKEESPKIDFAKTSAAQYKYMWDAPVRHGLSFTTDSIITRWIDPQPMVSGPYQRWV